MALSDADMIDFRDARPGDLAFADPAPLESGCRRIVGWFAGEVVCWFDWTGDRRGPVTIVPGSRGDRISALAVEHAVIGFVRLGR